MSDIALIEPKLTILPEQQRRLWPDLASVPDHFVLCGGTAIALQLGHRESVDFDFFSNQNFDPDSLLATLPFLNDATVIQREKNTLTAVVDYDGAVTVSFFGLPNIQPIKSYSIAADNGIKIAPLTDLAGMKASVVQKRAEWKDYIDMTALMDAGISLEQALLAAKAIYGGQFNPQITLKALSYFDDVKGLSDEARQKLQDAVRGVDLRQFSELTLFDSTNHQGVE